MNLNPVGSPSYQWLNYPAPPVRDLLRRVFRLADSTWAKDFLFFPNPNVDAGILTSPLNLQHRVAGQIRLDMKQERPPGPYNNEPYMDTTDLSRCSDDRLYSDWVIVPAFNFGQQGACYFMHKSMSTKSVNAASSSTYSAGNGGEVVDDNGAVRSALYRIITDDITGEVLYVGDMPETDKFQVVHMQHINGAYHERAMCFFEGTIFRNALANTNGEQLSYEQLAKALTLCIHTRETRLCVVCGAEPNKFCNCKIILKQAQHPHDLRFYGYNTRTHLGQYSGKEYLMYMRNGMVVAKRPQLTQHRTNCDLNRDTVRALSVWAVQDRLGNILGKSIFTPPSNININIDLGGANINIGGAHTSSHQTQLAIENSNAKSLEEIVDALGESTAHTTAQYRGQWNQQSQSTELDITNDIRSRQQHNSPAACLSEVPYSANGPSGGSLDISQQLEATHLVSESPASSIGTLPPANIIGNNQSNSSNINCQLHGSLHVQNPSSSGCNLGTNSGASSLTAALLSTPQQQIIAQRQYTSPLMQAPPPPQQQHGGLGAHNNSNRQAYMMMPSTEVAPAYANPLCYVSPAHNVSLVQPINNNMSGTSTSTIACGTSRRAQRPAVRERRLLPRGNRPVQPAAGPKDRELELRIRKREAARRSDQRRLAKVQQLQEETVKLDKIAEDLRKREKMLKEENEALRHQISRKAAAASSPSPSHD